MGLIKRLNRYADQANAGMSKQQRQLANDSKRVSAPISEVGKQTAAGLACPKCGSTQFKARRSRKARAGILAAGVTGVGAIAGAAVTRQKQVTCVACGTIYKRG